jgi:CubicO group peptidase (beta-lactamase class C family)
VIRLTRCSRATDRSDGNSAPGAGFLYSDPGADVLGAVLEVVAATTLDSILPAEVFEPLGMAETHAVLDRKSSNDVRIASLYEPTVEGWRRIWKPGDPPFLPFARGSGTSWYSSPEGYARFLRVWSSGGTVDGVRWLPEAQVSAALAPVSPMPSYASAIPGVRVWYGQFWQVYVAETGRRVAFGHSGAAGTYAWVWPAEGVTVLYFTQSLGQRTRLEVERLLPALVNELSAA